MGAAVDKTFLIIAGTAKFLVSRRYARTSHSSYLTIKYNSRRELLKHGSAASVSMLMDDEKVDYTQERKYDSEYDLTQCIMRVKEELQINNDNDSDCEDEFMFSLSDASDVASENPYGLSILVKDLKKRAEQIKNHGLHNSFSSGRFDECSIDSNE